jgi:amidase
MFRSGGGTFDLLALPTAQVWPFDIEMRWPHEVAGRAMDTYHRWMECTIYATYAGLPAISMPAGFSPCGRPAGIQLIGSPLNDVSVLRYAAAYERLIDDFNVGQA